MAQVNNNVQLHQLYCSNIMYYKVMYFFRYALYLVLLSKFVPDPDSLEVPMFFGFVGLLDGIILAPVLVSWHYFGLETFQLPPTNEVWTILLVNGFVGTVLSELLWLWYVQVHVRDVSIVHVHVSMCTMICYIHVDVV